LDEIRNLVPGRIDDAQVFEPRLRRVQRFRWKIHAHKSLRRNLERLRVTPFVTIECKTRLRDDERGQRDDGAEVMGQVKPRCSFHCFSWLPLGTADTETTRQLRLSRRR